MMFNDKNKMIPACLPFCESMQSHQQQAHEAPIYQFTVIQKMKRGIITAIFETAHTLTQTVMEIFRVT